MVRRVFFDVARYAMLPISFAVQRLISLMRCFTPMMLPDLPFTPLSPPP